jgi:acyl carrier protein
MDDLIDELKRKIIAALKLEDVRPEQIDAAAPLFGSGLGLDSIDALELVVMLERDYGIVIKDAAVSRDALASVHALAEFVRAHRRRPEAPSA